MPYIPRTVGHWDSLGYTRCVSCAQGRDVSADIVIDAGNSACDGICCDVCGESIHYNTKDLIHV